MANLQAKNVFIDTEFFEAMNLNFEHTMFKEFVRFAQVEFVKVFLTTVTVSEKTGHIAERIHEASLHLKRFRKEGRVLRNVSACYCIFADFDEQAAVAEVQKKFEEFLAKVHAKVLDLQEADAGAILDAYFQKKAPFGAGKKKDEFPDAFAQQALKKWCEENGCKMYVVSADADWQSCGSPLIPLPRLQEFIDAGVKDQSEDLSERVLGLYKKNINKVEAAVKAAFEDSGFYTDDVDGDVNGVKIIRPELDDPLVLEVDEGTATISVSAVLDYEADVSFRIDWVSPEAIAIA